MSAEHQNKTASRPAKVQYIVIGIFIGVAIWTAATTMQARELRQREELSRQRIDIIKLQHYLLLPSELIYHDENLVGRDVSEARIKSMESRGVESYLPYKNVRHLWSRVGESAFPTSRGVSLYTNFEFERELSQTSYDACSRLAYALSNDRGVGRFLKEHPEKFDMHVRPLVIRFLDAYHPWPRIAACEILLAMGDRSEEVLEILLLASKDSAGYSNVSDIIKKYGLNMTLDAPPDFESWEGRERSIEESMSAWRRTHEIANEMKIRYPIQYGITVINDWEGYCFEGETSRSPWPIFRD